MVIDGKLVVEVMSTADLRMEAGRQLYNYLKASKIEVGLLLHFGPEPKFFRVLCRHAPNPPNPIKSV
jgi:GxxExxY protein